MAQLLVRNVSEETVSRLKTRAQQNGRSVEAEHRAVLEAACPPDQDDVWAQMAAIRKKIGPMPDDSADLIREDRDSR